MSNVAQIEADIEPVKAKNFKELAAANDFDLDTLKDKHELRRQEKLFELCSFEKNYVLNLFNLKTKVIDPLRAKGLMTQSALDVLFANIEDILELHAAFLHSLVAQQRASVVIDHIQSEENFLTQLVLYKDYAKSHARQRKRLLELQQQPDFTDFLDECWESLERKDVDLYSYLSLPFYQVVQYPPILSKILKNTPYDHPDTKHLHANIPAASKLAKKCRETFLAVQNKTRMQELNNQVIGFHVMTEGREFIREGTVEVIDSRPHKRYAFLFNDVLLLARARDTRPPSFKAIRDIPVRKALYQFGDEVLQILFDVNKLARLRFPSGVREVWYKTLKGLQQPSIAHKKWPQEMKLAQKGGASSAELSDVRRKHQKLLQLVEKYEQLSSLHLTAMSKNDGMMNDAVRRIERLERQMGALGSGDAGQLSAVLTDENDRLADENRALREGLIKVQQVVSRSASEHSASEPEVEPASSSEQEQETDESSVSSVSSVSSTGSQSRVAQAAAREAVAMRTIDRQTSTFEDMAVAGTQGGSLSLDSILGGGAEGAGEAEATAVADDAKDAPDGSDETPPVSSISDDDSSDDSFVEP